MLGSGNRSLWSGVLENQQPLSRSLLRGTSPLKLDGCPNAKRCQGTDTTLRSICVIIASLAIVFLFLESPVVQAAQQNLNVKLPGSVELPALGDKGTLTDNVHLPENVQCDFNLVVPSVLKRRYRLTRQGKTRHWDLEVSVLVGPVGAFTINNGKLFFQWDKKANKTIRDDLQNCLLEIGIDGNIHPMQLRTPTVGSSFGITHKNEGTIPNAGVKKRPGEVEIRKEAVVGAPIAAEGLQYQVSPSATNLWPVTPRNPFPVEAVPLRTHISWGSAKNIKKGGTLDVRFEWDVEADRDRIAILQTQKYKIKTGWRPLLGGDIKQHWADVLARYNKEWIAMEKYLNAWDRLLTDSIDKSRRIRKRGLQGAALTKALVDLQATGRARETRFGRATKSRIRLDQIIALEVGEFDTLRTLWEQFANQSVEYRVFFIAGIHEVVVIRSGNVPGRQGVFQADAEGNIEYKIAMLPGGNKQPGLQGFRGDLPTQGDVEKVKNKHEKDMGALRKKTKLKIEDLREELDKLKNYLERVNG